MQGALTRTIAKGDVRYTSVLRAGQDLIIQATIPVVITRLGAIQHGVTDPVSQEGGVHTAALAAKGFARLGIAHAAPTISRTGAAIFVEGLVAVAVSADVAHGTKLIRFRSAGCAPFELATVGQLSADKPWALRT